MPSRAIIQVREIIRPLAALSSSMDTELKQYLDGMEGRMNAHVDQRLKESEANFEQRIKASETRVVTLITQVKESLERQMNQMNHRLDGLDARFEAQANRLDRQAALILVGSRWSTRMAAWADRVDLALDKKSEQIIDLQLCG